MLFGLTDHLEAPRGQNAADVYQRVAARTILADQLGFDYAWFSEHHAHAHHGHLPAPLLLALHLTGRTRCIQLGTAIICLNIHHPLDVAEQVAVADVLSGGRIAPGFGSGSTPEEYRYFGLSEGSEDERHERFAEALEIVLEAWSGHINDKSRRYFTIPSHDPLPAAAPDLQRRSWLSVNSLGAARIAGKLGFNVLYSHLRTPEQYRAYRNAYHAAGGHGLVAANRPIYVGRDDASAFREAEPALRTLWRRFHKEGKIAKELNEPNDVRDLCRHPINFIVGGPQSAAEQLLKLREQAPFDVANVEVCWDDIAPKLMDDCLRRIAEEVRPLIQVGY